MTPVNLPAMTRHKTRSRRRAIEQESRPTMKLVIFGLTISSSWGNGHATLLRGLFRALVRRGHRIVFFERDVPYYAAHRDLQELNGVELHLYSVWADALPAAGA